MNPRPRRSRAVTIAAFAVLLLAGGSWVQAGAGLSNAGLLRRLDLPVPWWYFSFGGAVWGAVWTAAGVGLWRNREWARRLALAAIPLQLIVWLADREFVARSALSAQSLAFDFFLRLLVSIAGFGLLLLAGRLDFRGNSAPDHPFPPPESG